MTDDKKDTRYPYTYACDYIRSLGGCDKTGVKISRSEASSIIYGVAKAIHIDKKKLSELLADAELSKSEDDRKNEVEQLIKCIRGVDY